MTNTEKLTVLLKVWRHECGLSWIEMVIVDRFYFIHPDQIDIDYAGLINLNLGD